MWTALILMAGHSKRFGGDLPKQYHLLKGRPVYLYTLEALQRSQLFNHIILVVSHYYKGILAHEGVEIIEGGKTRRESSYRGLLACPPSTEYVLIHDAVRPFVSQRILEDNVEAALKYGAVDTCVESPDTLVKREGEFLLEIPPRELYLRGQTPQTFAYKIIRKAHEEAPFFTEHVDDCRLVLESGVRPYIVRGEEHNFKITTLQDLQRAENL